MVVARRDVITAFYIVFLGIIPGIALVSLFIYYSKRNPTVFTKKPHQPMYVNPHIDTIDQKHAMITKKTPIPSAPPDPYEPIYAEIPEPVYDSVPTEEVPNDESCTLKSIKSKPLITKHELVFTTNAQALKLLKSNK